MPPEPTFPSPKTLLKRLNLRPRKIWGQHFLVHPHQARRIVEALELTPGDLALEIGPGLGALTVFLAQQAGKVTAVERDPILARFLREDLLAGCPNVDIVAGDILDFDIPALSRRAGQPLKVAGNLPYQITSPLLFKLIAEKTALARAVLMVQQEVGDRLSAPPGGKDYGILTVLCGYYFQVRRLFSLGPGNFYPPPQVDSVVLEFRPGSAVPRARDEALLARLVKGAFARRRKTLLNNLAPLAAGWGLTPGELQASLAAAGIDPGRRGETLDVAEFVRLSDALAAR